MPVTALRRSPSASAEESSSSENVLPASTTPKEVWKFTLIFGFARLLFQVLSSMAYLSRL